MPGLHRTGGLWKGAALGATICAAALAIAPIAARAATTWTLATTPSDSHSALGGVACADATHCWAVGEDDGTVLIETWNGSTWVASSGSEDGALSAISCFSNSNCWAVGLEDDESAVHAGGGSGGDVPLFAHWDGTSWTFTDGIGSGQYDTSGDTELESVSCPSATLCWAVGVVSPYASGNPDTTLYEEYTGGAWSEDTADSGVAGDTDATLNGISCGDATHCQAVGNWDSGPNSDEAFTSGWTSSGGWNDTTGGEGTLNVTTSLSAGYGALQGVSCVSADDCWAVGYWDGSALHALFATWGGSGWTVDTTNSAAAGAANNGASNDNYLYGISCTSADTCAAVGDYHAPPDQTLVDAYGASWSLVSGTPDSSSSVQNDLSAVACVSSLCVAAGSAFPTGGADNPVILMQSAAAPASSVPVPVPATGGALAAAPPVTAGPGVALLAGGLGLLLLAGVATLPGWRRLRRHG